MTHRNRRAGETDLMNAKTPRSPRRNAEKEDEEQIHSSLLGRLTLAVLASWRSSTSYDL
jgi:hypothetical protein